VNLLPAERQRQILSSLTERGAVRISDLSRMLGVSEMTIHRDLNELAARGRLTKVRGGAVLSQASESERTCFICRREHQGRMQMVLRMTDEGQRNTCCPHCGLMALSDVRGQVRSALVTDFLYGRMVNCRAATYIIEPQISVCCSPTVLAFEKREDALCFQKGFGGRVAQFEDALAMIESEMALKKG
jgi:DNA-binding MarR family transcriptional regulator